MSEWQCECFGGVLPIGEVDENGYIEIQGCDECAIFDSDLQAALVVSPTIALAPKFYPDDESEPWEFCSPGEFDKRLEGRTGRIMVHEKCFEIYKRWTAQHGTGAVNALKAVSGELQGAIDEHGKVPRREIDVDVLDDSSTPCRLVFGLTSNMMIECGEPLPTVWKEELKEMVRERSESEELTPEQERAVTYALYLDRAVEVGFATIEYPEGTGKFRAFLNDGAIMRNALERGFKGPRITMFEGWKALEQASTRVGDRPGPCGCIHGTLPIRMYNAGDFVAIRACDRCNKFSSAAEAAFAVVHGGAGEVVWSDGKSSVVMHSVDEVGAHKREGELLVGFGDWDVFRKLEDPDLRRELDPRINQEAIAIMFEEGVSSKTVTMSTVCEILDPMEQVWGVPLPCVTEKELAALTAGTNMPRCNHEGCNHDKEKAQTLSSMLLVMDRATKVGLASLFGATSSGMAYELDVVEVRNMVVKEGPVAVRERILNYWPELEDVRASIEALNAEE